MVLITKKNWGGWWWWDRYKTSSTTTHTIVSTWSLTFTVDAGLAYIPQQDVIIVYDATNNMHGTITSYSGTTMIVDIQHKTGSGTYSSWVINLDWIQAWLTSLGHGQATTWNSSTEAVDWGGIFETDIYVTSPNEASISRNTTDGANKIADFSFATSSFTKAFLSQSSWDVDFSDWSRTEIGTDDGNKNAYMSQYAYDYVTGKWETGTFKNFVDRVQANRYHETRDDTGSVSPQNWLYTDKDWNFMSAPLNKLFDYVGPIATLTTDELYVNYQMYCYGASNFQGTFDVTGLASFYSQVNFYSTTYFSSTTFFSAGFGSTVTNLLNASLTNIQTGANGLSALNIAQTWNTTGTPNIVNISLTDTASNIASNVFRYQLGGTTKVTLNKNGTLNLDVASSGVASITVGFDGGYSFSGGIGFIKRDSIIGLGIQYNVASSYINGHIFRGSANYTTTSGNVFLAQNIGTFAPTSGTATFTYQGISGTINQTGGASGITRWLYINPTLTAAADFRAIDVITGKTHLRDLKLTTAGDGLYIKEGVNATMWVATLVAGSVVVSTTKVTANSRIQITIQSLGTVTVPTVIWVTARTAGTSFTITSANVLDTSTIAWMIVEPA